MFEEFDRSQIDLGEVTVNCVVGGAGPPVLLLHGFPQNLAMWARVAPQLATRFTVVCATCADTAIPRNPDVRRTSPTTPSAQWPKIRSA
ncbi:MAG TPA: alpha/beta fold hydrolase [Gemmataceae bacterium]|nr:alpha/beta fold hydrolase [Gemmataceae bacterium]